MTAALSGTGSTSLSSFVQATTPVVFVNGAPDGSLQVAGYEKTAPLGTCAAELVWANASDLSVDHWLSSELTVAVPHRLIDGEVRWQALLSGCAADLERGRATGIDRRSVTVKDRLALLLEQSAGSLGVVPEEGDTLGTFLTRLSVQLSASLTVVCEPRLMDTPLDTASTDLDPVGPALHGVLSRNGLTLCQSLAVTGHSVSRTLQVLPDRAGRRIALPWPDDQGVGGGVLRVDAKHPTHPPRQWVARGGRPVIEDTFTLAPGWDPALQGQPDSDYDRLTSSDFSRFGPVYRTWVLNEDGAFSGPPFHAGDAYDAGALFGAAGTITSPLPLGACLTRDPSGQAVAPVIESSPDSGATWSVYPGVAAVLRDRAGVVLKDDALPAGILAAAKAGTLRLRVTASIQCPSRVEARRWDGNPFAGSGPTRVFNLGDDYRWYSVAPTSIHAPALASGDLAADVADDRAALRVALLDAIDRSRGAPLRATVELAGAWTTISAGDRIDAVLAPGVSIDGRPARFGGRTARVRSVRLTFGVGDRSPRTTLQLD